MIEIDVVSILKEDSEIFSREKITHVCTVKEGMTLLAALAIQIADENMLFEDALLFSKDSRDVDGMIKTAISHFHLKGISKSFYNCNNSILKEYFDKVDILKQSSKGYMSFQVADFIESTRCRH
jgi:hypothetical protein